MAGKTTGSALVDGLEGSDQAKDWCRAILDTLSGATTVVDAARSIGCNQAHFYKVRGRALQAMLSDLEPKRPGRKPAPPAPPTERLAELEAELLHAKGALEAASARVTLALGVPGSTRRPKGLGRAHPSN
jgi:transposase-like protein